MPDSPSSLTRRGFVVASMIFFAGCGTRKTTTLLPGPIWDDAPLAPLPPPPTQAMPRASSSMRIISRSTWAKGAPVPANMNTMQPAKYITLHHDGMTPFTDTTSASTAARLETIRTAHRRRDGGRWGDIGYHYAIDPAGRVWAARPLQYQGAHVKGRNEDNIGVVVLGNYDKQSLNRAQQATIQRAVAMLMKTHSIPVTRVHTHQEWAPTACPGESMQRFMTSIRRTSLRA